MILNLNGNFLTHFFYFVISCQESLKKICHWVSEEKKHVRFGNWDAKEVSVLRFDCLVSA